MSYLPIKTQSHYSLQLGLSQPSQIVNKCKDNNLPGCCLTDLNSVSGGVEFNDACCKKDLKPILGINIHIYEGDIDNKANIDLHEVIILAKNYQGWLNLVQLISEANTHYFDAPRSSFSSLLKFVDSNNIVISGWMGSEVGNSIFEDIHCTCKNNDVKSNIIKGWVDKSKSVISKYKEAFGEDFYLGVQLIDSFVFESAEYVAKAIRWLGPKCGVKILALADSYYPSSNDFNDQHVLLCNKLKTNMSSIEYVLVKNKDMCLGKFFQQNKYFIPSYEEMIEFGYTEEELANTLEIIDKCEVYKLTHDPMLPKFDIPPEYSDCNEYLRKICEDGIEFRREEIEDVISRTSYVWDDYYKRLEEEFSVLSEFGLSDYFLIVYDIYKYAMDNGILVGAGRGSAAGSLILYLLGVTHVDPIEYDLLFARFMNKGRMSKDHISLPDVDMDFEKHGREKMIEYVKSRYGEDHVAQICTFGELRGRSAFKEVARAHNALDEETKNKITNFIPHKEEIADQLKDMEEPSIIRWALENHPKDFQEWVEIDKQGELQGPYAKIFEQAIRLEGTKRQIGKHAAGIIISTVPLADICPMMYDKNSGDIMTAMEMNTLESMGHVKFDFLGLAGLSKVKVALNYLRSGELTL